MSSSQLYSYDDEQQQFRRHHQNMTDGENTNLLEHIITGDDDDNENEKITTTARTTKNQNQDDFLLVFKTIPEIFRFSPPVVSQFVSHQVSELLLLFDNNNQDEEEEDQNSLHNLLHLSPKLKRWLRTSLSKHLLDLVDGSFQASKLFSGKSTVIDQDVANEFEEQELFHHRHQQSSSHHNENPDHKKEKQENNNSNNNYSSYTVTSGGLKQQSTISSFNACTAAFNSLADFYSTFESLMQYFGNELLFSEVFEKLIALEYEELVLSALEEEEEERMMTFQIKKIKLDEEKAKVERVLSKMLVLPQAKTGENNIHHNQNNIAADSSSVPITTITTTIEKLKSDLTEKRRLRAEKNSQRREHLEIEAAKILSTGQLVVFCFVAFGKDLVDKIFSSIEDSAKVKGFDETLMKLRQQYEQLIQQRDAAVVVVATSSSSSSSSACSSSEKLCADLLTSKYRWEYDVDAKKVISSKIRLMKIMFSSSKQEEASLQSLDKNNKNVVAPTMTKKSSSSSSSSAAVCAFCKMQKETVNKFYGEKIMK